MTKTVILGVNAYHADASACLVREGYLVAAAEEERFRRIKHWAGLPIEAIKWCLHEGGINLADVTHIAINQNSSANRWRRVAYLITQRPDLRSVFKRVQNKRQRARADRLIEREIGETFRGECRYVEHHLAHLCSAFLVSPFENAVAVSIDGFGDFASAAWGLGKGSRVAVEGQVYFPHSLGIFYQALTQYLGFPHYGDEYKVMGLAPYGTPSYLDHMRRIVLLQKDGRFKLNLSFFRHATERIEYQWDNGEPTVGPIFSPALEMLLGPARKPSQELTQDHKNIARSVQAMYEEAFFNLLSALSKRYSADSLVLAGGCAMNSVANGKVLGNTDFKRLYVQAAAGDAGGAIGAAYAVLQELGGIDRAFVMNHAYWGPAFSDDEIGSLIKAHAAELRAGDCAVSEVKDEQDLCSITAQSVASGEVVGWFQGRMEWGPRALGNRSIICDPRRADMKDILNRKIKRRESFRPFAPSILREAVPDWFETDDEVPFMMQVYQIKREKRQAIPAVTHVDGSGRLQTVTRATNHLYYDLINSFRSITGIPLVLNTSFNENEPVVCSPIEALNCFMRTNMDMLVMGTWIVRRAGRR
jgi:carbamoyltransferase